MVRRKEKQVAEKPPTSLTLGATSLGRGPDDDDIAKLTEERKLLPIYIDL